MSFVPLQGPATLIAADPPRESEVEFSAPSAGRLGHGRVVRMPMRGAIPVLTRALRSEDAHHSVSLLGGATLLAMRLVAAGRVRLTDAGDAWRAGPLLPEDDERVRALAQARAGHDEYDARVRLVREVLDAVADTMTRTPTAPRPAPVPPAESFRSLLPPVPSLRGLRRETPETPGTPEGADDPDLPTAVTLSLRVEAPEEQLVGGLVTLVLQVHDAGDPAHLCDAEALWDFGEGHRGGFGLGARLATGLALREAARAWPVLERLRALPVPDRVVLEGEDLADLLEQGVAALGAAGVDVYWPRGLRAELTPHAHVEARPRPGTGRHEPLVEGLFGPDALFSFDWRLALAAGSGSEDRMLTEAEMTALATATSPVVRLRDNWVVVDPALARRARRRVGRREPSRMLPPGAALAAVLTGIVDFDGEPVPVHAGARLGRVRDLVADAANVAPLPPPAGLHGTLRDYQRRGVTWLAELTGVGLGACLADDMGLGKTLTLIALHLHRRERGLAHGPTLVVCPTSLLGNWEQEIRRFAPGVPVRRFHGSSRELSPAAVGDGFVLTTYGTMRRDVETAGGEKGAETGALAGVAWDLVVADEAQHVKNAASSTARALRGIGSRCRVALTGTPVENDLTELWAILDWAVPGLLGSRNAFRKRWAAPIESGVDPAVAREFAQLVEPFLLRRRKSDPGIAPELPPKTETDQVVALTREQVVLYETLVRTSMERIAEADDVTRRGLVLAMLTGLKQICNHPAHYLRQPATRLRGRSEKLDLLEELLGTILAEGGSVLVFTQYVAMARLLERRLADLGVPTLFLHGGTPVRDREEMVARFQDGDVPVFLLSLKAGGTGLNLTRADHVVHYDRWWNPAVEDQATDRAHRIGQTRPVQVHRLVTEGTVEERVGRLLEHKRALAESVLGSGDSRELALTELSDGELRDLVSLRIPLRTPHG